MAYTLHPCASAWAYLVTIKQCYHCISESQDKCIEFLNRKHTYFEHFIKLTGRLVVHCWIARFLKRLTFYRIYHWYYYFQTFEVRNGCVAGICYTLHSNIQWEFERQHLTLNSVQVCLSAFNLGTILVSVHFELRRALGDLGLTLKLNRVNCPASTNKCCANKCYKKM